VLAYGVAIFIGAISGSTNPLNPLQANEKFASNSFLNHASFIEIKNKQELERTIYLAKQNHKPVLLVFTATWCHICEEQKKIFSAAESRKLLEKFILLRIDISDDSTINLAKKFNIIAPPETVFFDASGQRVPLRLPDDLSVATLLTALNQILNQNH
jgi:thiol:disulfide interchange protein DsbD